MLGKGGKVETGGKLGLVDWRRCAWNCICEYHWIRVLNQNRINANSQRNLNEFNPNYCTSKCGKKGVDVLTQKINDLFPPQHEDEDQCASMEMIYRG